MFALNVFPLTVSSVRAASGRSLLESVDEDWEPLRVVAALLSPSSESVVILDIFPFSHAARHTFCFVLSFMFPSILFLPCFTGFTLALGTKKASMNGTSHYVLYQRTKLNVPLDAQSCKASDWLFRK